AAQPSVDPKQVRDLAAGRWIANGENVLLLGPPGSRRYERGAILLTSNRRVGEWFAVFGDPVVATALLDRLLHHRNVITIRGDSYRMREKRRSGLIKPAPPHDQTPAQSPANPVP